MCLWRCNNLMIDNFQYFSLVSLCFTLILKLYFSKLYYKGVINSMTEATQKIENLILELNKSGLSYLVNKQFGQAIEYLKKAEKTVTDELRIDPSNPKINQIAGITFNNLACYYKKNKKPKVALGYLKKALQLQVYRVEDWVSTASTHINICAIYSFLGNHKESAEHAELALSMLQRVDPSNLKQGEEDGQKSFWNIKMLSHYNLAIQFEHLKRYQQSKKQYQIAKQTAQQNDKKNQNIISAIQESIVRVDEAQKSHKTKVLSLLANRKMQEEKGYSEFMRRNKKHYGNQAAWKSIVQNRKYQIYKTEHDKRSYQSTQKVKKLAPLDGSHSKRGLDIK